MVKPSSVTKKRRRRGGSRAAFDTALGWRSGWTPSNIARWVLIVLSVIVFGLPFWAMFVNAFDLHPNISVFHLWPEQFSFQPWIAAYDAGVFDYLYNSFVILGGGLVLQIGTSIAASYALSRYNFKGASAAMGAFLLTMMLPTDLIAVPLSVVLGNVPPFGISVRGTPWGVILPVAVWGFTVLLMTEFMKEIPKEIEDSARVDGAGHLRLLFAIILPMSKPVLGIATIFGFIMIWDQYMLPLIAADTSDDYTLAVALRVLGEDPQTGSAVVMVGAVLALLPSIIIFAILQKSLISGIASGAVKG